MVRFFTRSVQLSFQPGTWYRDVGMKRTIWSQWMEGKLKSFWRTFEFSPPRSPRIWGFQFWCSPNHYIPTSLRLRRARNERRPGGHGGRPGWVGHSYCQRTENGYPVNQHSYGSHGHPWPIVDLCIYIYIYIYPLKMWFSTAMSVYQEGRCCEHLWSLKKNDGGILRTGFFVVRLMSCMGEPWPKIWPLGYPALRRRQVTVT